MNLAKYAINKLGGRLISKPKLLFSSTIDPKEIQNFSKVSDWWQFSGSQQALQAYNFLRINYLRQIMNKERNIDISIRKPLKGLDILDVGCGGGLLSEVL